MMSGISIVSPAIAVNRAFSSARSGVPGAYVRLASLTGSGTRRTPAKEAGARLVGFMGFKGVVEFMGFTRFVGS